MVNGAPAAAFNLERYRDSNGKWYPVRWGPGTRTVRFQVITFDIEQSAIAGIHQQRNAVAACAFTCSAARLAS